MRTKNKVTFKVTFKAGSNLMRDRTAGHAHANYVA